MVSLVVGLELARTRTLMGGKGRVGGELGSGGRERGFGGCWESVVVS